MNPVLLTFSCFLMPCLGTWSNLIMHHPKTKLLLVKEMFSEAQVRNSLTHSHCFNLNSQAIIATQRAPMISSNIYLS